MDDLLNRLRAFYENADTDECLGDIRDAIEELERLRWIPVSERLPEWGEFVIVAYNVACGPPQREVGAECHYADGVWTGCDKMRGGQPTHWMPLPEPPA